jgi:predicted dehydrogenase
MFKLGIIGSDNTHAETFARLVNHAALDGTHYEDVRATHIYGTDPVRTREVADAADIPHIVPKLEDMIDKVDGVVCVWRHGGRHLADTLPFLEAGVPAFVDKPLAVSVADAEKLIGAAEHAGVGFSSFSTLRFADATLAFMADVEERVGPLTAGVSTGPADVNSEYGGIFFYGIHAVELMNTVWGYGCRSVCASAHNGNISAACKLESGALVTLNLLGNASSVFHLAAHGPKGWLASPVDAGTSYIQGMRVIIDTLRLNEWPLTRDQLLEPVKILNAIQRSLDDQCEVSLDEN